MAVESQSTATFYCDGPNCDVEEVDNDYDFNTPPNGWLMVDGPSSNLGRFHFHSGLCYDNWLNNLNTHLATKEKSNG